MNSVLVVAGENSGEKYGADLVREFKKIRPAFSIFGIGGRYMKEEGVELVSSIEDLSAIGIAEIIFQLPSIKKIFDLILKEAEARRPVCAVLIDSPDFNLRLAKRLKKIRIPVLYYISPTVWAWRKGRLKTIKQTVEKMLLIFPFEEAIFRDTGTPAAYVGHPLKERVRAKFNRQQFFEKYGLDPRKKLLTLLPGSRKSELKSHLPVLLTSMKMLKEEVPAQFILLQAESLDRSSLLRYIPQETPWMRVLAEDGYDAMAASDLVLSACGTANLEACLLEIPFVSFYRLSPLTYYPGVLLVKIKNYSIVNILAGRTVVPELIQHKFTSENILREAKQLLTDEERRLRMVEEFKKIKAMLGEERASLNAARELDELITRTAEG